MDRRLGRGVGRGLVAALGMVGLAAVATAGASAVAARAIVTPPSRQREDVRIIGVDLDAGTVTLEATDDAVVPGVFGFWFDDGRGHARIGEIVTRERGIVVRRTLGVDHGDLAHARRGRVSGWVHLSPQTLDVPWEEVRIPTPLGDAPAWYVPVEAGSASRRWVIGVHGRAVTRREPLRAIPPFRAEGYDSLLVSYRNDGEAPTSLDGRYGLGSREWRDVEAAIRFALAHGAEEIVLMGWSMGGATVLQTVMRSAYRERITGVVLESPVVDWVETLDFQARAHYLPWAVRQGALALLRSRAARPITGLAQPLDFSRMDFVTRASELDRPILILHSVDDGFVPAGSSQLLAAARPDLVTLELFETARHTKLWNFDADRWEAAIRVWLSERAARSPRDA